MLLVGSLVAALGTVLQRAGRPPTKLLVRLLETVEKTAEGLFAPWQIRRRGRAELDLQLAQAQAEQDIEDITRGRKHFTSDYQLVDGPTPSAGGHEDGCTLAGLATHNVIVERMRIELNVGQAFLNAAAELDGDAQEPPDRRVDDDWLWRWREAAGGVSSEKLQLLWGKVLAGEIRSPGTFSLRTLEFLKNLSQDEALRIEKLAPFVVDSDFVVGEDENLLASEGISFGLLVELQDLGVVTAATPGIRKTIRSKLPNQFRCGIASYDRVLVVTHEDEKKALSLKGYRLSTLGSQVIRLGAFTPHERYFRSVGIAIKRQGFGVLYARFTQVTETEGRWHDEEKL